MNRTILLAAAFALAAPAMPAAAHPDTAIEDVLAHERRADDRARDAWRHPAETLAFFQVEPGMTVVDFMPAGGWYSRVLIPFLGPQGTYIALNPAPHPGMSAFWQGHRGTAEKFPAQAREWVGEGHAAVIGANADDDLAPIAGTADRVLIFREMHNIRRFGWLHETMVTARKLLKDDGLLGIVQHRAGSGTSVDYALGGKGYQREEDVIALVSAHGFELVAKSEINANPADRANWEAGVWWLPPSFSGADSDEERARRAAIGESDRMTLLFRKRN